MKHTTHRAQPRRAMFGKHPSHTPPRASDPVDDTTLYGERAPRGGRQKPDNTGALWSFLGGLFVSLVAVALGEMSGWLLLGLVVSMGYAWMPSKPAPPTPRVHPKPTRISPRMQRWLTEPKGMVVLGCVLTASMILVGWLSNV